jgi:hypothetical protein
LFALDSKLAEDNALRATKVFTGHAGEVTSLVVAKDQTWFVTGGTDHTVAAWSLRDWASEPGLGATFLEKENRVVVAALDVGSPAWEAGLRVSDVLDLLAVDGSLVYDMRDTTQPFGTVARAIESLKTPRPRIELFFGIAGTATTPRRDTLTTVRQRPLWKWLPAFDNQNRMNDWVVWMWHGSYYHTKTANGDRLAGWHMNHAEPGGRPQFYPLQQFEKHFHAPEVIETLFKTRDLKTALTKARGENPTLLSFTKFEPVPVRLALQHTDIRASGLALTVTVTPRGSNPDLLPVRVELWLNEHRLETWPATGEKIDTKQLFEAKVIIPANKFRSGTNTITAIVVNAGGGHAEDVQRVTSNTATASKLLACFAGVNDYSATRKAKDTTTHLPDLKFANSDAEAFAKTISPFSGEKKLYSLAHIRTHANASRKQLLETLAEFASVAKPDDLLVFAFVGHTEAVAGRGPVLCLANYTRDTRDTTGLQAEELFDAIAKINCRKIVLFDTMRATDSNILRAFTSLGPSPIVVGACEFGERSGEDVTRGRGYFAAALLDSLESDKGFRKADYNLDGAISIDEWFEAATLAKQLRPPVCYPRELPKTAIWKR